MTLNFIIAIFIDIIISKNLVLRVEIGSKYQFWVSLIYNLQIVYIR